MNKEQKIYIDNMSHYAICSLWRFGNSENELLQGECGQYLSKRLKDLGGFTSEISKELGW